MSHLEAWDTGRAETIIHDLAHLPGALLPILHALQEHFGYVDPESIPLIAEALNISNAEVHGVITFYHDFHTKPGGKHRLQICRAEACQSMGCDTLIAHVEKRLDARLGESTKDGVFKLDAVYCLGNCSNSPSIMMDGKPYGRVSTHVADVIIDDTRKRGGKSA